MMKYKFIFFALLTIGFILISCEKGIDPLEDKGTLFVVSEPEDAVIYIDGRNTNLKTPSEIEALTGIHEITLKKEGYLDFSFMDTIFVGLKRLSPIVELTKMSIITIKSIPAFASLFIDGENTFDLTTAFFSKPNGTYFITLKADDHLDTTFSVFIDNTQNLEFNIDLRAKFIKYFEGVVIYDTTNSALNEPGGLSLATGEAVSIMDNSSRKGFADLIFVPNEIGGYDLKSPNGTNGMFRETRFYVSNSSNINDYLDLEIANPTWRNSFSSNTENYVFVYDADGHYSKIQIVNVYENPKRVELKWIYNEDAFQPKF